MTEKIIILGFMVAISLFAVTMCRDHAANYERCTKICSPYQFESVAPGDKCVCDLKKELR